MFIFFLIFYLITSLPTAGFYDTFKYVGSYIVLFSPMFILSYYVKSGNISLLKKILYATYFIWAITAFRALQFYTLNPGAARRLANDQSAFGEIAIGGGYSLSIGSAILAVFLLDITLNKFIEKRSRRFIASILIIILSLVILRTWSTITLFGLIFGIVISLVFVLISDSKGKVVQSHKSILVLTVIVIIFFVILFNINYISETIIYLTEGSSNRMY